MSVLTELSSALTEAVEAVSPSLVYVDARRGYGATGLAWKSDGQIITASHVVQRDENITIALAGGEPVPARVLGRDRATDIAVLRAESSLESTIQPATSEAKVGNIVLALGMGAPEPPAASFGVIATINRPWRSSRGRTIEELIRSDVTLYPGFSGGPLVDAAGRIAGMNTSALARGLAATIPWNVLERTAEALATEGSVKRGYLGIVSQPVQIPEPMRAGAGITQETGLLVVGVESESPADAAGLIVGDIVVQVDDAPIVGIEDLLEWLTSAPVGSEARITLLRAGNLTDVAITIGER